MRRWVAITFRGTYIHASKDGRKTLCGARIHETQPYEFDPSDELSCARCAQIAARGD